jgi:hypothetical protein
MPGRSYDAWVEATGVTVDDCTDGAMLSVPPPGRSTDALVEVFKTAGCKGAFGFFKCAVT